MPRSALAACSSSPESSWGNSPVIAGLKNAAPVPHSADSSARASTETWPVNSKMATPDWTTKRSASALSITRRRDTRSATAPPKSKKMTMAAVPAPSTSPTWRALPWWFSTAKVMATGVI